MEQRDDALLGIGGEIGLEPELLRGAYGRRHERVVAVEDDDVPGAEVLAVVALRRVARLRSPIPEVRGGGGARVVVLVAQHWKRPCLLRSPRRVEARLPPARYECSVPGDEYGAGDVGEQRGGGLRVRGAVTPRDVAGP